MASQQTPATGFKLINRRQTLNNKDNLLKVINYKATANGSYEITLNCSNSKIAKTLTQELNKIAQTPSIEQEDFQLPATEFYSSPFHIE